MTPDPRAVAKGILSHLVLSFEETHDGRSVSYNHDTLIGVIEKALADERRRGMEEAAELVQGYADVCTSGQTAYRKATLEVMAAQIRAQAQAGKEGA